MENRFLVEEVEKGAVVVDTNPEACVGKHEVAAWIRRPDVAEAVAETLDKMTADS